jgi:hypothetical protein
MIRIGNRSFAKAVLTDYEFRALPGERPGPIWCCVWRDLETGETHRHWEDDLRARTVPPYPIDADTVVIAYYAAAEVGCHLALGWQPPTYILDLFAEFRNLTNGTKPVAGNGLLGALTYFGLDAMSVTEKTEMRDLAIRGGPFTTAERDALLDYCESDVIALDKLVRCMPLDGARSLLRGKYMCAVAAMEHIGVPIDMPMLMALRGSWDDLRMQLVARIDRDYGVFVGLTFKRDLFARLLAARGIPWPRLPSGALALDDDTFKEMCLRHPVLRPLHELRVSLSQLRLEHLAVGHDGRNRTLLSAYRTKTGRNAPSTAKFVFGPATWLRGLIRPEPGMALAMIDYRQEEFAIAASLSGDAAMLEAYCSGDPYLQFAKQAGAVPADATRETHREVRELFKTCALGVQYGMQAKTLAARIGRDPAAAEALLRLHRKTYARFWDWSDGAVAYALLHNEIRTVFGWTLHVGPAVTTRSLCNYPMQANGAEILRLACSRAVEAGVQVCAPVHDALLIEAPVGEIDNMVHITEEIMADASATVLSGFRLRTDAKMISYPERYLDPRGRGMWGAVMTALAEVGHQRPTDFDTSADDRTPAPPRPIS